MIHYTLHVFLLELLARLTCSVSLCLRLSSGKLTTHIIQEQQAEFDC